MTALSPNQITRYLERIGLSTPLAPTAQNLSAIQWAHLHAVPFENLDICPLDQPFTLDMDAIYDKVVLRRRGGFCFELNGLLAELLASLGYQVERMAANFADEPEPDPFDHLVLIVTVPEDSSRWYADVAAGRASPERAIPVDGVSADGQRRTRFADGRWIAEGLGEDGAWNPILSWDPQPQPLSAFHSRCAHFQMHPDSFFRQGAMCTMLSEGGRATLSKRLMITTIDGERTERALESDGEIAEILRSVFGIDIPVDARWR